MSGNGQWDRFVHENFVRRAKPPAVDRRADRTRTALIQALHGLAEEKDYETITVGEIAAAANVGRSTFYAHFLGKDDLLRYGVARLGEHFSDWEESTSSAGDEADPLGFSLFLFQFFHHWPALSRAIARGHARKLVSDHMRKLLTDVLRKRLPGMGPENAETMPRELAVQHVIGAFMSVFYWWLERGTKERPEEMDIAFRRLAMGGLGALAAPGR